MATGQHMMITTEDSENVFNYQELKENFISYLKLKNNKNYYPETTEDLNKIIFLLKTRSYGYEKYDYYFSIRKKNNETVLMKRNSDMQAVPLIEVFDVILEAHVFFNHGRKLDTEKFIADNYFIKKEWFNKFMCMCNVCCDSCSSKQQTYEFKVYASIEKLVDKSNIAHRVLFYVDNNSQYVVMRCLDSFTESVAKVFAVELLKIFADFGVPKIIKTNTSDGHVITSALKILNDLSVPYALPLVQNVKDGKIRGLPLVQKIMSSQATNVFPVILSSLQFKINTKKFSDSSYLSLFRVIQNTEVYKLKEALDENKYNLVCAKCSESVQKIFVCHKCEKLFHITCCEQEFIREIKEFRVTCANCKADVNN